MLKTLLKKQLYELGITMFTRSGKKGKNGKKPGKGSAVAMALLMVYAFGCVGFLFFMVANGMCSALVGMGYGVLYFALMAIMATLMGVVGSVFTAYSALYKAKDNDLMLSLPIPPWMILFARMAGLYILTFFFEFLVLTPTYAVYMINCGVTPQVMVSFILALVFLPLFGVAVSCLLGWLVALLSRFTGGKTKTYLTVLLSLVFFIAYYYVVSKATDVLNLILANAARLNDMLSTALFPLYHLGKASLGSWPSLALFILPLSAIFALVYVLLSRGFIKMATTNRGEKKAVYKKQAMSSGSAASALLKREFTHLQSSATYMLNCALGTLMMLVCAVLLIVKADDIFAGLAFMLSGDKGFLGLIAVAVVAFAASMNDLTAPSISLEGKSLWIVRSLPVPTWWVLRAKLQLHVILTAVPAAILMLAACWALKLPALWWPLGVLAVTVFSLLNACFGLVIGIKMPNFDAPNETVAVKQSMGVMIAIFGSWGIVLLFGGLYALTHSFLSPIWYMVCAILLASALCTLALWWFKGRGSKLVENY